MPRSALESTKPGGWRCASAFVVPSISSCRPPRQTMGSIFRSPSSTASPWPTFFISSILRRRGKCWNRRRWRWDAGRALALVRFRNGKKVPPPIQRMRSDDLLAAVFPEAQACQENLSGPIAIPDHPLIREAMKDVLTEAMDLEGFQKVLADIFEGRIRCVAVDTPATQRIRPSKISANTF